MNVILSLDPEVEKGLMARAHARGVSLDDYLQELVAREAGETGGAETGSADAGANLDLERSQGFPTIVGMTAYAT